MASDVVFLVPAKGHSDRLPRKNLTDLWGKPMFAWSLEAVAKSMRYDGTNAFVATESPEVASASKLWSRAKVLRERKWRQCGVAPLLRRIAKKAYRTPVTICVVYPNCPARLPSTIDRVLDLIDQGCNSVKTYDSDGIEIGNVWAIRFRPRFRDEILYTYTGAVVDDATEIHTQEDLDDVLPILRDRLAEEIAAVPTSKTAS